MPPISLITHSEYEKKLLDQRTLALQEEFQDQHQQQRSGEEWMVFHLNGLNYAIERRYVFEVHMAVSPVSVPCTPAFVKGIVNLRGDILSVIDLGLFIESSPLQEQTSYPLLRLKTPTMEMGLLVDEVRDIRYFQPSDLHPFQYESQVRMNHYLIGVSSDLIHILDTHALLEDERLIVSA